MTYAENTNVASEQSRAEIERTLRRYGADAFMFGWESGPDARAVVQFRARGRYVKFDVPMPSHSEFRLTPTRRQVRSTAEVEKAWEQAQRQRWRALALVIKAKLEAVEAGITTFEHEFLAHTLLPNGQTVGDWTEPQIAEAYDRGEMPRLLPAGS